MGENFLDIDGLTKDFGKLRVVKNVDLGFAKGEFISLLGPSGCGKTTVLRMIAGFEAPTGGTIAVEGVDITGLNPNQRKIGMVFQAYALFPNMNVADNIGFGLRVKHTARETIRKRVDEMLELIGLKGFGKRYPFELSGGQQQRVALARALAPSPRMLLLDEPLSALDAKIRVSLREQIRQIQRDLGITTVFVTHDQEEALSISDRIVVMNAGAVEQVGTPFDVYNQPQTRFVAGFVGTLNTLDAVVHDAGTGTVKFAGQSVRVKALPEGLENGAEVALAVRPESMWLKSVRDSEVTLTGRVLDVNFLGSVIRLKVDVEGRELSLDMFNDQQTPPPAYGSEVALGFAAEDLLALSE